MCFSFSDYNSPPSPHIQKKNKNQKNRGVPKKQQQRTVVSLLAFGWFQKPLLSYNNYFWRQHIYILLQNTILASMDSLGLTFGDWSQ